jgi:hypothetical protein
MEKARRVFEKRKLIEEKILMARAQKPFNSPMVIAGDTEVTNGSFDKSPHGG